MKAEFEQKDIEEIAQRVMELLKPLLVGNSKIDSVDKIFNKDELAKYLHTSKSTINKLVSDNQIPFFKLSQGHSGGVRFYKKSIDNWILRQTIPEIGQFTR